jgi:hypothetical protein
MFGTLVGVVIGGEAIRQVGGIGSFPSGLKSVTQAGIGLGVASNALKGTKSIFKIK